LETKQIENEQEKSEKEIIINIQERIIQAWQKKNSNREGIHVSDLLHCRRLSCFKALDPEPSTPNLAGIKNMLVGAAIHREIQALLGTDEYYHERPITFTTKTGVTVKATPDIIHKATGTIIEMKTTLSVRVMREPYSSHLTQLKIYMSILGVPIGMLFYVLLGTTTGDNHFKQYSVTLTQKERQKILNKLEKDAEEFQHGMDAKNPALVSHIADDSQYVTSLGYNWMCKSCKHQSRCLKMRVEEWKRHNIAA
jgi:hypothetical protein